MPITILIADDHAIIRDGLRALIAPHPDLQVIGDAADGRQAVQQVKQLKPQVVIMDITMPKLNGIDATHQIMEADPATRVVILSMHTGWRQINRALQAGACGYLLKDTAGEEVVAAIRTVGAGRRYLSRYISEAESDSPLVGGAQTDPLGVLSAREREVLQLTVEGKTIKEIALALNLSPRSVETYRTRIREKLDIRNISALIHFAIQQGMTPPD